MRALERSQNAARTREAELTDRILSMKGYREFGPIWQPSQSLEPIENSQGNIEWQETSILAEEGFRPY